MYEGPLPAQYPFCSERCKLVDLGKWLRGDYFIERPLTEEDVEALPEQMRWRATERDLGAD